MEFKQITYSQVPTAKAAAGLDLASLQLVCGDLKFCNF